MNLGKELTVKEWVGINISISVCFFLLDGGVQAVSRLSNFFRSVKDFDCLR